MKLIFSILWIVSAIVLLDVPPEPWSVLGHLLLITWPLCLGVLVFRSLHSRVMKTERLLYEALEQGVVHGLELASRHKLTPATVRIIISEWQSKGWIKQCDPPEGAHAGLEGAGITSHVRAKSGWARSSETLTPKESEMKSLKYLRAAYKADRSHQRAKRQFGQQTRWRRIGETILLALKHFHW